MPAPRGLNRKIHLAVDTHGMSVRLALTDGTVAECTRTESLTAARGSGTDASVAGAIAQGMEPVIPPRSHRKYPRHCDRNLYRLRHFVKNAFLNLEEWRSVATRYSKRNASFLAICQIRARVLWTRFF